MLVGNKRRFAIEADPQAVDGSWIFGGFRFWLRGDSVGDWEDTCALQYCRSWLEDFWRRPVDRFDKMLVAKTPSEMFGLIVDPVIANPGIPDPRQQIVPYSYERFHISHLGMSSFDRYILVLVKEIDGSERCLWKVLDDPLIHDCRLGPWEMEQVALDFCYEYDRVIDRLRSTF